MKKVLAMIGLLLFLFAMALFNQARSNKEVEREYLHENRPDVVAAIEAYRKANGHYPESISNAIPRFYHGDQEHIFFLKAYAYKDHGSSYSLKRFTDKTGA